ncbi:MAG: nucleotidyl transferase AbiEii/AbiGii toxin family protein [Planctomycetales bacterium]|nr:nucleotidyl transferase AbiEii/AbiGii toxin family protein [Planctomycetales bacterium]
MDGVAKLPQDERRLYFEQAAVRMGRLTPQLIEKDFWVCWILRRVFRLAEFHDHLTFKGGTSLSKVYQAIERFSEDIDLSIERGFLGFGGERDPEQGLTGNEQRRRIHALRDACQQAVARRFHPQLKDAISEQLGETGNWQLSLDTDDPDSQSLLFHFPLAVIDRVSPYFAQSVKLEIGARSDHFPIEAATVRPYLSDAIPETCDDCDVALRVLAGERTFWEKATILHSLCHQDISKPIQQRQSRHFYDLFQLANHRIGQAALQSIELLERVATHKSVYFKSASAKYGEAKPGTLKLVPAEERVRELKADYASMHSMFFSDPPTFDTILDRLRQLEAEINA